MVRLVGLFAGIGGIEEGFRTALGAGVETTLLCESWLPAQQVLADQLPDVPLHPDVRTLAAIPADTDVLAAGFPCTDLSQAGRTAGIRGEQSGLVAHVFRLIDAAGPVGPRWLLIENVLNMLMLDRGEAMRFLVDALEARGYRWAYRVVDSRFAGVPQRRRRVLLLASRTEDPRAVLFADDAGEPVSSRYRADAFGFYWTEGRGGLGWAEDAVPTLKGGSTIGIPSPPAVWFPDAPAGRQLLRPSIEEAERAQGFPPGWTAAAEGSGRKGPRWKMVGNAVTVGVAAWLAGRIIAPATVGVKAAPLAAGRWPLAACGDRTRRWSVSISEYPEHSRYLHLSDLVDQASASPLSRRATAGFWSRLTSANLGRYPGFREAVACHLAEAERPDEVRECSARAS